MSGPMPAAVPTARATRLAPTVGLAFVLLVATAAPAGAHTVLRASVPADGATVDAFDQLELHFTEPVEVSATHVYVEDTVGFIELPNASAIDGDATAIRLAVPPLGEGTYRFTWHVVATDGDPAEGSFSVTVAPTGARTAPPADPAADLPPDTSLAIPLDDFRVVRAASPAHGHGPGAAAESTARMLLDLATAVLVGGAVFLSVAWPRGARVLRARQLLWVAGGLGIVASYELTALQHARVAGLSTRSALLPWHQLGVLDDRFGRVGALRVVCLLAALALVAHLARDGAARIRSWRWRAAAATVGLGLLQTVVLLGHPQSSGPVARAARLAHLGGLSVWVGGLAMLLLVVLPRRRGDELATVLPRFSALATGAVVVVVAAGLGLAFELVGGVDALVSTGYGRILLAKVAVVAAALAVAARSRHLLAVRAGDARDLPRIGPADAPRRLRAGGAPTLALPADATGSPVPALVGRCIATEAALLVVVFAATAVLLASTPPG